MTGFLLDTNVVSEMRRPKPDPAVVAWLDKADAHTLFLSAISVAEISAGIGAMPAGARRDAIERWLDAIVHERFQGRVVPFATEAAWIVRDLVVRSRASGRPAGLADMQIAATAAAHRLTVATRDTGDFANLGVPIVNPWLEPSAPQERDD